MPSEHTEYYCKRCYCFYNALETEKAVRDDINLKRVIKQLKEKKMDSMADKLIRYSETLCYSCINNIVSFFNMNKDIIGIE